jgi:hypothetical protein
MTWLVWIVTIPIAYAALSWIQAQRRNARRPPGPPGLPLIGNVLSIPKDNQWIVWDSWRKVYGLSLLPLWLGSRSEHRTNQATSFTSRSWARRTSFCPRMRLQVNCSTLEVRMQLCLHGASLTVDSGLIYSDRPRAVMAGELYVELIPYHEVL